MKIQLNRVPYMCPVIEDSMGNSGGHYIFDSQWIGHTIDLQVDSEDDCFWIGTFKTSIGWLKCELLKECFNVIPEET